MKKNNQYIPQPLDTSSVELPANLLELTEILAKNAHEVWASLRIAEGWQYGTERNDERKEHPCLVSYEDLPESEREYDRKMAINTLKIVMGQGFRIEKRK